MPWGKHLKKVRVPLRKIDYFALWAGQIAGGDKRGKQSSALLVVREGWSYGGLTDRFHDLRVDDHHPPFRNWKEFTIYIARFSHAGWVIGLK